MNRAAHNYPVRKGYQELSYEKMCDAVLDFVSLGLILLVHHPLYEVEKQCQLKYQRQRREYHQHRIPVVQFRVVIGEPPVDDAQN